MKITKIIAEQIYKSIHNAVCSNIKRKTKEEMINGIFQHIQRDMKIILEGRTAIPDSQVNGSAPKHLIQLEDFIKVFQKKKDEYVETLYDASYSVAQSELSGFMRWLIEQTGQFKRLNAERKELLSQADDKDREIRKYIENRWVEEAK